MFVAGRRAPLPLHGFFEPCLLSIAIANRGVNAFQNLTLVIAGTPKAMGHPADFCKHFVEVPAPFLAPVYVSACNFDGVDGPCSNRGAGCRHGT